MRLNKSKDGYYRTSFTLNGKKYRLVGKTQKEISDKRKEIEEKARLGINSNDVIFSKFAYNWLSLLDLTNAPKTIEMYECALNRAIKPYGDTLLRKITTNDLQNVINGIIDKPRSCQIFKRTMIRVFDAAVEQGIIIKNPANSLVVPRYKAKEKKILSDVDVEKIRNANLDNEERLFIDILFYTGLRMGEALALKWEDIDLENGFLKVYKSLAFKDNIGYIKSPKTEKSNRTIPIPSDLLTTLEKVKGKGYIFNRDGKAFTKSAYRRMWERIKSKTDVDMSAHILRHNYCSILHKNNIDIKQAQILMGHSSYQVTADIYTHLGDNQDEMLKESIRKVVF